MPKPRDWSQDECDYLVAAWNDVSQDASLTRGRIADLVVSRLQSQFGQHTRFKCNSVKTIYDQRSASGSDCGCLRQLTHSPP